MQVEQIANPSEYLKLVEQHFLDLTPPKESRDKSNNEEGNNLKHAKWGAGLLFSIARRMISDPSEEHERYCVREYKDTKNENTFPNIRLIAVRTPPLYLVIGYGDIESTIVLVNTFIDNYPDYILPGIVGRKVLVDLFCERYFAATGLSRESSMNQLLHVLVEYQQPKRIPNGYWKVAEEEHRELLIQWVIQFGIDAKVPTEYEKSREYAEALVSNRLNERVIYLWVVSEGEDNQTENPVAMTFVSPAADDIVRIGLVFTPLDHRNHGYASILVNLLSKFFLDQEKTCLLYTDASNPISNSIYYQIGYRVISEEAVVKFTQPKDS